MTRSVRTPPVILHQTEVMLNPEARESKSAVREALPGISALLPIRNNQTLYRQELGQDSVEVRMRGVVIEIPSQMFASHLWWRRWQGQSFIINEVAEETQAGCEQDTQLQSLRRHCRKKRAWAWAIEMLVGPSTQVPHPEALHRHFFKMPTRIKSRGLVSTALRHRFLKQECRSRAE